MDRTERSEEDNNDSSTEPRLSDEEDYTLEEEKMCEQ
jgi:hypothetical protein